jgi:hypothetical protein
VFFRCQPETQQIAYMHALGVQYAAKEFTLQIEMKLLASLLVKAMEETGINSELT